MAPANSAIAMIFLQENTLLKRDLSFDDIKPRLLGESILHMHLARMYTDSMCVQATGEHAPVSFWYIPT